MAHQKRHLASDSLHDAASPAVVPAHAHECAPRAPRRRDHLARRLGADLPFLLLACQEYFTGRKVDLLEGHGAFLGDYPFEFDYQIALDPEAALIFSFIWNLQD